MLISQNGLVKQRLFYGGIGGVCRKVSIEHLHGRLSAARIGSLPFSEEKIKSN